MQQVPEAEWKELVSRKDEFLHILRILNHYYEMTGKTKNDLFAFRNKLVNLPPDTVSIYLSKIGPYEYFVRACLDQKFETAETWVHIDGIAEERAKFIEIGNQNHPVFSITCLQDLYDSATLPYVPKNNSKKKVAKSKKAIKI